MRGRSAKPAPNQPSALPHILPWLSVLPRPPGPHLKSVYQLGLPCPSMAYQTSARYHLIFRPSSRTMTIWCSSVAATAAALRFLSVSPRCLLTPLLLLVPFCRFAVGLPDLFGSSTDMSPLFTTMRRTGAGYRNRTRVHAVQVHRFTTKLNRHLIKG